MKLLIFVVVLAILITAPTFSYLYWVKEYGLVASLMGGFFIGMFSYITLSYFLGLLVMLYSKSRKR